jgi:hypothetical protein
MLPPEREGDLVVFREKEINGLKLALAVEHSGSPFWLIATRGIKRNAEVFRRIYDERVEAERAYNYVAVRLAFDRLREVIGDDDVFVRLLKGLRRAEQDPAFIALVTSDDDAALTARLRVLFAEAELVN